MRILLILIYKIHPTLSFPISFSLFYKKKMVHLWDPSVLSIVLFLTRLDFFFLRDRLFFSLIEVSCLRKIVLVYRLSKKVSLLG